MMKYIKCILFILTIGMLSANAAVISWSAEQIADTGTAQISTDGMLLEARNLGYTGTVAAVVNGVTFERLVNTGDFNLSPYLGAALLPSGSVVEPVYQIGENPDYESLLYGYRARWTIGSSLAIANLTVGKEYQVQILAADLRGIAGVVDRSVEMDGVLYDTTGLTGSDGEGSGTILTGTFIADATTQSFTMNLYDAGSAANVAGWTISAYQIRDVSDSAENISWRVEQIDASGTDQISTVGALLEARNLGSTGTEDATVGGVTFKQMVQTADFTGSSHLGAALLNSSGLGTMAYLYGGNADYADLLDGFRGQWTPNVPVTIANLTVGREYQIQVFFADFRYTSGVIDRFIEVDGLLYYTIGLTGSDGDGAGVVLTGTFTADATSKSFTLNNYDPSSASYVASWCVSAYQLRDLSAVGNTVTWDVDQIDATGTDQISTNGTLLEAGNLGIEGTTDATVGGVTFEQMVYGDDFDAAPYLGASLLSGGRTVGDTYVQGQNTGYTGLLDAYRYQLSVDVSLTIANLTVGRDYEIQLFVADLRTASAVANRIVEMDDVLYQSSGFIGVNGDDNGTVLTGTFTAESTSQTFTLNIYDPDNTANVTGWNVNAYQLRDVTPAPPVYDPLPATMSVVANGGSIIVTAGSMQGDSSVTNILQARADLMSGTWTNLYSASGVTSTNWTLPMDSAQGFFRVLSTN